MIQHFVAPNDERRAIASHDRHRLMPNVASVNERVTKSMFVDREHSERRLFERRCARREQTDARADTIDAAFDANVDRHRSLVAMHFEIRDVGRLLAWRRVAHAERVSCAQCDAFVASQRFKQRRNKICVFLFL